MRVWKRSKRASEPLGDRVRVYEGLRTAHLERFTVLEPATVLYFRPSYDFDEPLAARLDVRRCRSRLDLFRRLLMSRTAVLEINEPLTLPGILSALVAVLAVRLSTLFGGVRTTIVTYAIENADPFRRRPRVHAAWRSRLYELGARFLLSQVDRLAFGTASARDTYEPYLGRFRGRAELVEALPSPCAACRRDVEHGGAPGRVVFLGAFAERKGLPDVIAAWPEVTRRRPDARLSLLGKGPLQALAEAAAAGNPSITLITDPPREQIHRELAAAKVLVLLSMPEQVGLPIVEGLEHGCEIVCTDQTGLAEWLRSHGHQVLAAQPLDPESVVAALVAALNAARPRRAVLEALPQEDGRLAADRWMFAEDDGRPVPPADSGARGLS